MSTRTAESATQGARLADEARAFADDAREQIRSHALESGPEAPAVLAERVGAMLERLRAALRDDRVGRDAMAAADTCEAVIDVTELEQELQEHLIAQRFHALSRIHAGLTRLRALPTVAELLTQTPREICACCDFDRALVSRVQGSTWLPEVLYMAPDLDPEIDERSQRYIHETQIPLSPMLLETELARRAAPALVCDPAGDPRTHKPLVEATATRAYVAAPVVQGRRVIGFLHADTFASGRPLTAVDRDNLFTFAEGFGLIFERVVLLQRLEEQRKRVADAFHAAEGHIVELCDAEVKLARQESESPAVSATAVDMFAPAESRLHLLLTAREREVLTLMVGGARNSAIADQLVISEGTVKSHVKNICRKLRASNRAEAVARYLQMVMRAKA